MVVVIGEDEGRLANRLTRLTNLISITEQLDAVLIDPGFVEHRSSFRAFESSTVFIYHPTLEIKPSRKRCFACWIIRKCQYRKGSVPGSQTQGVRFLEFFEPKNLKTLSDDESFQNAAHDPLCKLVAVFGLYIDAQNRTPSIAARCREILAPQHLADTSQARVGTSREKIVGVHIRQGDYRTWKDGRFYFPPKIYAAAMSTITEVHPNLEITFHVCSDERLSPSTFTGLQVELLDGDAADDLFSLAASDAIISTFSSFAYFASFYGAKPLLDLSNQQPSCNKPIFHQSSIAWPQLGFETRSAESIP